MENISDKIDEYEGTLLADMLRDKIITNDKEVTELLIKQMETVWNAVTREPEEDN